MLPEIILSLTLGQAVESVHVHLEACSPAPCARKATITVRACDALKPKECATTTEPISESKADALMATARASWKRQRKAKRSY